jgi:hypothetical protein
MERLSPPLDLTKPRSVGELLTTTLELLRRHFGLFLSVTLLVVAPAMVLVEGVWGRMLRDGPDAANVASVNIAFLVLATLVIPPLVTGLHAVIVRDMGDGQVPGVGEALRAVAPRLPAAFGAIALFSAGTAIGFLLLIVPGIWLGVRWYFAAQAAVLEGTAPAASLRRSLELVDGRWWDVFGALLVSGILAAGVSAIATAVAGVVHAGVVYVTLITVIRAITLSYTALFGTLLFFTLRARQRASAVPAMPPA